MAKILVVDDSPTQLANMVRICQAHGHQTLTATNGAEGVAKNEADQPAEESDDAGIDADP